jgi:hypothetical protein
MRFLFFDVEAGKENTLSRSQNVEVIGVYAVAKHPVADCQRKRCVEVVARREAGT